MARSTAQRAADKRYREKHKNADVSWGTRLKPDEAAARLNIARERVDMPLDIVLSNSFGFGGTNSALIIRKVKQ